MKNIFKQLFCCFIVVPMLIISCKKDKTDSLDITEFKWKLKSLTINNETDTPSEKKKSSYILGFVNDSIFSLNLSVNTGRGGYLITANGQIIISSYGAGTKVCCENDFDLKLIDVMNAVTAYQVKGNKLILKGDKGEAEFKKKWL